MEKVCYRNLDRDSNTVSRAHTLGRSPLRQAPLPVVMQYGVIKCLPQPRYGTGTKKEKLYHISDSRTPFCSIQSTHGLTMHLIDACDTFQYPARHFSTGVTPQVTQYDVIKCWPRPRYGTKHTKNCV